jgi:hypothetical protein
MRQQNPVYALLCRCVQAQELSRSSQLHAEAAARDLLAAKKAEMQVLPLMTGGKNPDPAAAELLKAQAAAKCAEQLKVGEDLL